MNFDECFVALVAHEGDFADLENDPGGKTRFGVTWTACTWWSRRNVSPKRPVRPSWPAGAAERSRTASLGGSLLAPAAGS